ncbi:MAG: hypothetical protein WC581_03335 [Thermodesulfovibrionales bacterium]
MIEQDVLEKELLELVTLFKTGKSIKPTPEDNLKLQEIVKSDGKGLPIVIKFIHKFPPDIICKAIVQVWEHLNDDNKFKFVSEVIKLPKKDNDQKLKLIFVSYISEVDPKAALRLFKDICEGSFDKKQNVPKPKFAQLLRLVLLNSVSPNLIRLPIGSNSIEDINAVIICSLHSAFMINRSDRDLIPPEGQFSLLKWVRTARSLSDLPETMINSINEHIMKWPLSMVPSLKEILSLFPEILKKNTEDVWRDILAGMKEIGVPNTQHKTLHREIEPLRFNPQLVLNNLGEYIQSLEKKEHDLREDYQKALRKIEEVEAEVHSSGDLIANLRKKNNHLDKEKERLDDALKAEKEICSQLRPRINGLEENLSNAKNLAEELQTKIDILVKGHAEEIKKMVSKIDIESEHQLSVFMQKLAGSLAIEYADFKTIINKSMSTELGDSLREQLKKIFRKLEAEGVQFNKDMA